MKLLLIISAVIDAVVGASLVLLPALMMSTLLGAPADTPPGVASTRLAGAALFALAIACWNARDGERTGPAIGVVTASLFYRLGAIAVLVHAGVRLGLSSPLIWPSIVVYFALALWCVFSLWLTRRRATES